MHATAARPRRTSDIVGLALTWVGGSIAVLLLIPVLGLTSLAWGMSSSDALDPGLLVCRDRSCVDEMTAWTLAGLGATALVVTLVVLAVWSSTPSLVAATALGAAALVVLLRLALHLWELQPYAEVMAGLVLVMLAPTGLTLGSMLRLWARRGASDG